MVFLFLQENIQKRVVNPNLAVIFDKAQFSETIHEKAHSRPGCANHFSQYLLADLRNYRFRFAFFTELREQQQNPRQPLFAGIEKLIDQVRLDAGVPCEKKGDEHRRQFGLMVEYAHHFRLADPEQCTLGHCASRREVNRMG